MKKQKSHIRMSRQVDIKKGTGVVAATLLLLLVAVIADSTHKFTDVGDDLRAAEEGCIWHKTKPNSNGNGADYYTIDSSKRNPNTKERGNCMKACKNNTTCTHWVYLENKNKPTGSKKWECKILKDATTSYEARDLDNGWIAKESVCGYIPSRATNQQTN